MSKLLYIAATAAAAFGLSVPALAQNGYPTDSMAVAAEAFGSSAPAQTSPFTCVDGYIWDVGRDGFFHYDGQSDRVPCPTQVVYRNVTYTYVQERVGYGYYRYYLPYYSSGINVNVSRGSYRNGYRDGRRDASRDYRHGRPAARLTYPNRARGSSSGYGYQSDGRHYDNNRSRSDQGYGRNNNRGYRSDRNYTTVERRVQRNPGNNTRTVERRRFRNDHSSGYGHRSSYVRSSARTNDRSPRVQRSHAPRQRPERNRPWRR